MKKITIITLAMLCVALLCVAAACEPEDQLPQKYKITCASGEGYSVSDLPSESAEGSTVYFYVEATSVFYQIDKVTFNGTEIYEDDFGTYSFKMPAADVTVQVTATPAPEYDDPDDHLAWGSTVTGFISQASPSDQTASRDVEQEIPLTFPGISSAAWITSVDADLQISDESVIPADAIRYENVKASTSSAVIAGKLVVDLKKVSPGTTYIYVSLRPNNASLGTLMRKFTVTEYGQLQLDTVDVTLKITNRSDYEWEDVFINVSDRTPVYGSNAEDFYSIMLSETADGEVTVSLVPGHTYFVSAGTLSNRVSLSVDDWVGEGSSETGFNRIKDGNLTFLYPGVIQITIRNP